MKFSLSNTAGLFCASAAVLVSWQAATHDAPQHPGELPWALLALIASTVVLWWLGMKVITGHLEDPRLHFGISAVPLVLAIFVMSMSIVDSRHQARRALMDRNPTVVVGTVTACDPLRKSKFIQDKNAFILHITYRYAADGKDHIASDDIDDNDKTHTMCSSGHTLMVRYSRESPSISEIIRDNQSF